MEKQTNLFDRKTKQTGNIKSQPVFFRSKRKNSPKPTCHLSVFFNEKYTSWWFQPSWKIFVKMGSSSPSFFWVKIKKHLKPPPTSTSQRVLFEPSGMVYKHPLPSIQRLSTPWKIQVDIRIFRDAEGHVRVGIQLIEYQASDSRTENWGGKKRIQ